MPRRGVSRPAPPRPRSRRFPVPESVPVRLLVELQRGRAQDGRARLHDLSATGVFVRTSLRPRALRPATLRFCCGDRLCVAAGRVTSVRRGKGFAIAIDAANAAFDALVQELGAVRDDVSNDVLSLIASAELTIG